MNAPRQDEGAAQFEALASQWAKHLGEHKTARTAREAVRQGSHLLLLKEASSHGEWLSRTEELGLSVKTAARLMDAARRFGNANDAFFAAVGNFSKMSELVTLQDADLLARGGEVHGLTLDSIKSMTVKELREAVKLIVKTENTKLLIQFLEFRAQALPVVLSVEEERMLRLFRQCSTPAREALFGVAGLLARP